MQARPLTNDELFRAQEIVEYQTTLQRQRVYQFVDHNPDFLKMSVRDIAAGSRMPREVYVEWCMNLLLNLPGDQRAGAVDLFETLDHDQIEDLWVMLRDSLQARYADLMAQRASGRLTA